MIRLLFLLLGTPALKPLWKLLVTAGVIWVALGLIILFDLSDAKLSFALDTFAIFLFIEGFVIIGAAAAVGIRRYWIDALRGLAFLFAGFLVFNVPWDGNIFAAIVFGAAFLIDGLFRLASSMVVRGSRWRIGIVVAFAEISCAIAVFMSWPIPHLLTVPFCFALLLLFSGYSLIRMALPLRKLPADAAISDLSFYRAHNWQVGATRPLRLLETDEWSSQDDTLNVYVWTASGSIADPQRRLLVDRYVAAVDRNGVISTGHAAVEMPPDLYISHYPANDIDHSPEDFRAILNAGHDNDVAGRFNHSLAQESADWCMPDRTVTFHHFRPEALRRFWADYSKDTTYNLTARNCSTTAVMALDAALEGSCSTGRVVADLFRVLVNPQFWLLTLVRGRAEAMTWTPGLVLDYAGLLRDVVEHSEHRWTRKLDSAWRKRDIVDNGTSGS